MSIECPHNADPRYHGRAVEKMNTAAKAKSKPAGRRWQVLSRDVPLLTIRRRDRQRRTDGGERSEQCPD
jgi:hypothetical protein